MSRTGRLHAAIDGADVSIIDVQRGSWDTLAAHALLAAIAHQAVRAVLVAVARRSAAASQRRVAEGRLWIPGSVIDGRALGVIGRDVAGVDVLVAGHDDAGDR